MSEPAPPTIDSQAYAVLQQELVALRQRVAVLEQTQTTPSPTPLQRILDAIPQAIFWKDLQSVYLGCNQTFATAAGLTRPTEIIGKTDYDLPWTTAEADLYRQNDRQVMENGTSLNHILEPQLRANGEQRWCDVNKIPLRSPTGEIIGILGTFEDVTDRIEAEEQLRQQEQFLRCIYDGADQALFVIDVTPEGAFHYAGFNPAAEQMTGLSKAKVVGKTPEEVFGSAIGTRISQHYQQCLAANHAIAYEECNRFGDREVWTLTTLSPLRNDEGRVTRLIGTASNISDRKFAEEALQENYGLLYSVIESTSDVIFAKDLEGRYVLMNSKLAAFHHKSPIEMTGMTDRELLPEVAEAVQVKDREIIQIGAAQTYEEQIPVYGQLCTYLTTKSPWRDAQGNILGVVGISRDITERKEAEKALHAALAESKGLNAILNNLADGLLVTDRQGYILQVNPMLLELFNLRPVEVGDQHCQRVFPPEIWDLVQQTQNQPDAVVTGELTLTQNRIGHAAATAIFREATFNEPELCIGSAVLIRDITYERELDQMKTDFLSTVSHELRTPLTSVLGFASIIRERMEEVVLPALPTGNRSLQRAITKIMTNIDIIVAEAERLTALINDVLDIAKMEAGRIEWQMTPLQPQGVIDQAIAATSALFETSGLTLYQEIAPNLPPILGDRHRLIQVLINLLSNAVKFTPQGAVTCGAWIEANELRISVRDTGVGIAPEDQPKVFEKFRQVGDTLTDKPQGTGLGLPICQQIVEHHGGRIWVESLPGQGSTFTFTVPLQTACPSASYPSSMQPNWDAIVSQVKDHVTLAAPTASTSPKTILVVDDDASIRELLQQQLQSAGYRVLEARDGMEAINRAKAHHPDLITLDVMMPQINGFDVAAVLKNDPQTSAIPIIMLSIVEDKERGYRLGIDRYLTKPIKTPSLLQDIGILLAQGQSQKKVLIVDRNASTVKSLSDVLQAQGYRVAEAFNHEEGMNQARSLQPDMIIVDLRLSQENDWVRSLRFEKGLENVLVILMGDR